MSMSGGWFFVVASEAISVGDTTVTLPGIGSYIALAIAQRDLAGGRLGHRRHAGRHPRLRPAALSSARRLGGSLPIRAGVGRRAAALVGAFDAPPVGLVRAGWRRPWARFGGGPTARPPGAPTSAPEPAQAGRDRGRIGSGPMVDRRSVAALAVWRIATFVLGGLSLSEAATAFGLGCLTLARVLVLIVLASIVWVPIGVRVGMNPRVARFVQPIAQFLAAFPANLLFPVAVSAIVAYGLNPDVWLSPLMILGHAVVHPVQRHRRRFRPAVGAARRRDQPAECEAGCGGGRSRFPACSRTT